MDAIWTGQNDLTDRIDAEYYRPVFVEASKRLSRHVPAVPFSELWEEANRIYIGIAGFESVAALHEYTPYLRPVDITDEGIINYDKLPWCEKSWLDDHAAKGCAVPGDIIVEVKGNTKKVAVVSDRIPKNCIVSGSSYRVHLKPEHDPYYVSAFLLTEIGQLLKRRLTSNINISYIDPDSFRAFRIPKPSPPIQKAIGNCVRAAERLRNAATGSTETIKQWLETCLPSWDDPTEVLSVAPRFVRAVDTERLDPWFNHRQFDDLDEELSKRKNLVPFAKVANRIQDRWNATAGDIEYIEIGDFDLLQGTAFGRVIAAETAPSRARYAAKRGDVAVSLVRPNRKNVVFVQGSGSRQIVVTSGCDVFRFDDPDVAALYSIVLRHNAITHQIMRWNTGTSYPAIESLPEDRILVPSLPVDRREELLVAARHAVNGVERANSLTRAASEQVDRLIEGTLDEAECIEQGKQLAEEFGLEVPQ